MLSKYKKVIIIILIAIIGAIFLYSNKRKYASTKMWCTTSLVQVYKFDGQSCVHVRTNSNGCGPVEKDEYANGDPYRALEECERENNIKNKTWE